jgi:glycosyltransferase involved in cell wall biosynthesis
MRAKNIPIFTVIIPVYNNWESLKLCLEALKDQNIDKQLFEIIIVDNASSVTRPYSLRLPENASIIYEARAGAYAARNRGAKVARGILLAFTDSDCIPDKNWLRNARKIFKEKKCDLLGGKIEVFYKNGASEHTYIYDKYFAFRQRIWTAKGLSCTANLIIKKTIFFEAGRFDASLKSGGDWEFTKRCVDKEFRMAYGVSVVVEHPARKNLSALLKKHLRHVYWGSIITRRKFQCSQLKVLLSNLKGALIRLFKDKPRVAGWDETLIIFYIDFIKMVVQVYGNLLILFKVKDPSKVRE